MSSNPYLAKIMTDPEIMNNPRLLSLLNTYSDKLDWGGTGQDSSNTMSMYNTYNDRREALLNYYNEQEAAAQKTNASKSTGLQDEYTNTIDTLNQGLKSDITDLTNNSASKGSFGSTAYNEKQNSLAGQYQNKYNNVYNNAVQNANTYGLEGQKLIGGLTQTPTINKYQVNPNGSADVSNTYRYNPFQQKSGSIAGNKAYSLSGLATGK